MIEKSIFVPVKTPSQNKFQGHHWQTYYRRYRKTWDDAVGYMLGQGEHNDKHRECRITVYHKDKRSVYDFANLVGGAKPIPDALKKYGWIKDDKPQWFTCTYEQKFVGDDDTTEEGTRIELYRQTQTK